MDKHKKTAICALHEDIIDRAHQAMAANDNTFVDRILDDIIIIAQLAYVRGIEMEERLKEYKTGIENMGFRRDEKDENKYMEII